MILKKDIKKIEKLQFILDGEDVIQMDVPLTIRLLEYARETSSSDVDLHKIAERLVQHSKTHVVTMDCYDNIIGISSETPTLTEKSTLFRMNSRTLWSRFGWGPLNYSIALNNNLDGLNETENRIYAHAARIGELVTPYYGEEIGKTFTDALTQFAKIGVGVIQDLYNGKPLDGTKALWDESIENIATFLSTINPEYWPKDPIKSYLDALVNLWLDSINARESKDFAANEVAMDAIEKLVTLGTDTTPSLADVFSMGIISQYPEKFTD